MVYRYFAMMLFSQRWLERMDGMKTEYIEAFWQDATADDVARVMAGESVEARFRDGADQAWSDCFTLIGWVNERRHQWRSVEAGGRWNHCQVYREPSWWVERPNPGPGFRLLAKFPDEELKPGDEAWDLMGNGKWGDSNNTYYGMPQSETVWYRRRIEPVEPESQHYVLRVGDTVETPSGDRMKCVEPGIEQRHYALRATDTVGTPNGQTITITEKGFEVTQ